MEKTEMHASLSELFSDVDGMDMGVYQPTDPPIDTDEKLGEATPYMQKVFALAKFNRRLAKEKQLEHEFTPHDENCSAMHREISMYGERSDLLMEIFWFMAKSQTDKWYVDSDKVIGVRKGWMLVLSPRPKSKIERMLGGGFMLESE